MFLEGMIIMISSKPWTFKELGTSSEFWRLDLGMCFWNINDYTIIPSIQNNTTCHSRTKTKKQHNWTGMNCAHPKGQFYLFGDDRKLKLYCVVLCELKPFATRSSRDMMGRVRCVERECMNRAAVMWWNPTWWGWSCRPLQRMGLGVVER